MPPLTYAFGHVDLVMTIMSVIMVAFVVALGQATTTCRASTIVLMGLYFTFAAAYFVSDGEAKGPYYRALKAGVNYYVI